MDPISLEDYLSNSPPIEQQEISNLLMFIVEDIKNKGYPIELSLRNIIVSQQRDKYCLDYEIYSESSTNLYDKEDDKKEDKKDKKDNDPSKNPPPNLPKLTEPQKIIPICELILMLLGKNPGDDFEEVLSEIEDNPEIIKEFKSLLKVFYSKNCILNYNMFVLRIKNIYELFGKENIYNLTTENLFGTFQLKSERSKDESRKKLNLHDCNYCGCLSLEPMFKLNACGCMLHKQCFESAIVSTIEYKELREEFQLFKPCSTPNEHFNVSDLEIIVEIEKERFTLSRPIILMIKYYYLYWQESADYYCNCKIEGKHFKVNKLNKRPEMLCNGKCSFCGARWEEECPKFKRALNWAY